MSFLIIFLLCAGKVVANGFTTVWFFKSGDVLSLPFVAPVSVNVSWGDSNLQSFTATAAINHTYGAQGVYTVDISGSVVGWQFQGTGDSRFNLLRIDSWGGFTVDASSIGVFQGCANLSAITASDQPIMSAGSNLRWFFADCPLLNSPLSWDLQGVVSLEKFLSKASSFNQFVGFTNTGEVTDMSFMFESASAFNQNVSFNTSAVTTMRGVFESSGFNQPLTWDTAAVTDMSVMFANTTFNSTITFSSTRQVENMTLMFDGNNAIVHNFAAWSVPSATSCHSFCPFCGIPNFEQCSACLSGVVQTSEGWVACNCPPGQSCTVAEMFQSVWFVPAANATLYLPLLFGAVSISVDWGDNSPRAYLMTPVTHEYAASGLYNISIAGPVRNWNFISNGGNTNSIYLIKSWGQFYASEGAFQGCANLDVGVLSGSPIFLPGTSLAYFFAGCSSLNAPLDWNISGVTSLRGFLQDATSFNQVLGFTGTENVTDMAKLFFGATLYNRPLNLDFSSVTSMASMFAYSSFNQPISWRNTQQVTDMSRMFASTPFNSAIIFSTSFVANMSGMFMNATQYNAGNFFNTTSVRDMSHMFSGAFNFNQNLRVWYVPSVTKCNEFCEACGLPTFVACTPAPCFPLPMLASSMGWVVCKCPTSQTCGAIPCPSPAYTGNAGDCTCATNYSGIVSYGSTVQGCVEADTVSVPYSPTDPTVVKGPKGIIVIVNPDPAFNSSGNITVRILPQNQTSSVIARVVFVGPSGPQPIVGLFTNIVIRIPISNIVLDPIQICLGELAVRQAIVPECKYYDERLQQWVTSGCRRTNLSATEIECSCSHLTDFAAILPRFNAVPVSALLDLTSDNINDHPTGIVAVVIVFVVFLVLLGFAVYRDRKEALTPDLKALKQAKWGRYLADKRMGNRLSLWRELKVSFQKRHTWTSLINRKSGTSFQSVDRTFVALVTVFASMSISAHFHNLDQSWLGRGQVIVFSVMVCLLPAQFLAQLFVRTGPMGFYEEWEFSVGIQRPSKYRVLNYRFPGCWRWVWIGAAGVATLAMAVYILTISLMFDFVPKYYCLGNTASSWVSDWIASYAIAMLAVEPLKICVFVGVSRVRERFPLANLRSKSLPMQTQ